MPERLTIRVPHAGLHDITRTIEAFVARQPSNEGVCTIFIQHTSASLLVQESFDSSARTDLENWLNRLVPENDPLYTHTLEGVDDMPAHIKSALTSTHLSIPVMSGHLALGTWQGVYLWEHRYASSERHLVCHLSH